ncbi:uncharacterized protein CcaverHIS019_0212300 [Cutaneotrichosporon cavernicola]|uniref:Uncharacterized protein n=1 Tax=Cutaneotrichosporon cavernicola TaxID=279322 RepID=A0AA48IIS3_9TREE|nr:uncharacterized protein CcaverHIS019_0212300 [Cutaneotrichosporon cavernicola]BEI89868.1 hypothetical protein CcaverHIS019_0212300 [Cutaneotrichosporon cavernicola]BEI97638.1 hypothetical protein CcaverHIS631_0212270 [Cutaneotrichosporon cavernicola]BEJ05416.1 hypothetical protein CcaverHIS641_0212330 [Cutaneotrichosporon cavernicola]
MQDLDQDPDTEKRRERVPVDRRTSMPVPEPLTLRPHILQDIHEHPPSRSSSSSDDDDDDDSGRPRVDRHASVAPAYPVILGRRRTKYVRLPLLMRPLLDPHGAWLRIEDTATTWLSLFYDLAVGAILSAFNGSHELQTPGEMPSYFGYYVVIVSLWTTQLHYDIRYEGDDAVHRLLKPLHLLLFVYIGAASGGWDLSRLTVPTLEMSSTEAVAHSLAGDSFLTVAIAVALHRALLAAQYVMVVVLGKKAGRPVSSPALFAASFAITCIFAVLAATIPARNTGLAAAKIVLMYASVLVDMGAILVQVIWGVQVPVRWHSVAERYGSLTLIILGQGFSNLTTVFQNSLSGLGQHDTATYAQVFLAIGVMYDLWSFLFAHFRQEVPVDAGRTWLYEIIHFPLHFSMLLLLFGMVNTVSINSFAFGIVDAGNMFFTAVSYAQNNQPLASPAIRRIAINLNRLNTNPDFEAQYTILQGMANGTIAGDVELEAYTYLAQLLYAACQSSSIVVDSEADALLGQLYQVDQNATAAGFDIEEMRVYAAFLGIEALTSIVRSALKRTLWLYPAAGITLILCAMRSMTRYHFKGATHWVVHGLQLSVGTCVALLGLLGLGSGDVKVNWYKDELQVYRPLYSVVFQNMALAIVFIAYTSVVLGAAMWIEVTEHKDKLKEWWRKRFGKSTPAEDEVEEEAS